MGTMLTVDLDALRTLADKQVRNAEALRDIDLRSVFLAVQYALTGSEIAAHCERAGADAETAIGGVADRVDGLARANRRAAALIGAADDDYASGIHRLAHRL